MSNAWWELATAAAAGGMILWLIHIVLIPLLFRSDPASKSKQAPLKAQAGRGLMPAESTTFAGYYRQFRALGLNPIEAVRETLIYKLHGR